MRSLAFAVAVIASEAAAFWDTGHHLVARRAEMILEKEAPEALRQATAELKVLKNKRPDLITNEGSYPFVECATFADQLANDQVPGFEFEWGWHFIDQPYLDEPGTTLDDFNFTPDVTDVVGALTDLTKFLKREASPATSEYVAGIAGMFPEEEDQRSFTLRMLIHYVGDAHQPLHGVAAVDHKFPEGDAGGNGESVPDDDECHVVTLHAIYDSVTYHYCGYESYPFTEEHYGWYTAEADRLAEAFPTTEIDLKVGNYRSWADEDMELAMEYVYPGFIDGETPSQEYLDKATPMILQRLMLGGRRLAELLKEVYEESPSTFLQ